MLRWRSLRRNSGCPLLSNNQSMCRCLILPTHGVMDITQRNMLAVAKHNGVRRRVSRIRHCLQCRILSNNQRTH